jgi:GAF domain-containing protein
VLADPEFEWHEAQRIGGYRSVLAVPMLRQDNLVGLFFMWRTEVHAFTDKQIDLVATFADQAVIAIENVRLFKELEARTQDLTRSVGELRALGDVGRALSSTLDLYDEDVYLFARPGIRPPAIWSPPMTLRASGSPRA